MNIELYKREAINRCLIQFNNIDFDDTGNIENINNIIKDIYRTEMTIYVGKYNINLKTLSSKDINIIKTLIFDIIREAFNQFNIIV